MGGPRLFVIRPPALEGQRSRGLAAKVLAVTVAQLPHSGRAALHMFKNGISDIVTFLGALLTVLQGVSWVNQGVP